MNRIILFFLRTFSKIKTVIIACSNHVVIGKKSLVYYKSNIYSISGGKIIVGENCQIGRTKRGYHAGMPFYSTLLADKENAIIKIGNNCRLNGTYIHAKKSIVVGENCVIASGVNIIDSNGHKVNSKDRTTGRDEPSDIVIGNNVWIGINATILKGTVIGDNSIISAGSVVKGHFPDNTLISSIPFPRTKKLDIE